MVVSDPQAGTPASLTTGTGSKVLLVHLRLGPEYFQQISSIGALVLLLVGEYLVLLLVGEYLSPDNRWWEPCRVAGEVPNCTKKDWIFFTIFSSHMTSSSQENKKKEKHCTGRVTSHCLIIMKPMLVLLFCSTSVSTSGLKKGRAGWHFSLLAGAVRGERAQTGTALAKPNRTLKDEWRSVGPESHHSTNKPVTHQGFLSQVFCCDPSGGPQHTAGKQSLFGCPWIVIEEHLSIHLHLSTCSATKKLKSDRSSVASMSLAGIQLRSHFLWNQNLTCRKRSLPVMNHKDENSLELEATTAALVPALQFATLRSSYHLTQELSTTATAGNRPLMAPILQDLSTSSLCLHTGFCIGPNSQSNVYFNFLFSVAARDFRESVCLWSPHGAGCKDFLDSYYPMAPRHPMASQVSQCLVQYWVHP